MAKTQLASVVSARVVVPRAIDIFLRRALVIAIAPVIVARWRCTVVVTCAMSSPVVVIASFARTAAVVVVAGPVEIGARRASLESFLFELGLCLLEGAALVCFMPIAVTHLTGFVHIVRR